jgi:hypothetical protein
MNLRELENGLTNSRSGMMDVQRMNIKELNIEESLEILHWMNPVGTLDNG